MSPKNPPAGEHLKILDAERLAELADILTDPGLILGPLDVRDMVDALGELLTARRPPKRAPVQIPEAKPTALSESLRDAAALAEQGPLRARLVEAASGLDMLACAVRTALSVKEITVPNVVTLMLTALYHVGADE